MRVIDNALIGIFLLAVVANSIAGECDTALVADTYRQNTRFSSDYRLAEAVNEKTWNSFQKDLGGEAEVFGIKLGGSYKDFTANLHQLESSRGESLSIEQVENVLWTGLSKNSAGAYRDCVTRLNSSSLRAYVDYANETEVYINVIWFPHGDDTNPALIEWQAGSTEMAQLPKTPFKSGETPIRVLRPSKGSFTLVGSYKGYSTGVIVVTSMPDKPKPAIDVIGAWYGRNCPNKDGLDIKKRVKEECQNRPTCNFRVHSGADGNPCAEEKRIEISYQCTGEGPTVFIAQFGPNHKGKDGENEREADDHPLEFGCTPELKDIWK